MESSYQHTGGGSSDRILWVDTARCIAMFFIMWLHTRTAPSWLPFPVGGAICFFFLTAGYFLPRKPLECGKRTLQLIGAWLLWSLITVTLYLCVGSGMQFEWQRAIGWDAMAYNVPLWFLRNLIVYQLIFFILLLTRALPWGAAIVLFICCIWPYAKHGEHHIVLRYDWIIAVAIGFVIGNVGLARLSRMLERGMIPLTLLAGFLISFEFYKYPFAGYTWFSFSWALGDNLSHLSGDFSLNSLPLVALGLSLAYALVAVALTRWLPWASRVLAIVGRNMMFIYAGHSILYGMQVGIDLHYFGGKLADGVWLPIIAMVILTLISELLCKICPKLMVLLGSLSLRHWKRS